MEKLAPIRIINLHNDLFNTFYRIDSPIINTDEYVNLNKIHIHNLNCNSLLPSGSTKELNPHLEVSCHPCA